MPLTGATGQRAYYSPLYSGGGYAPEYDAVQSELDQAYQRNLQAQADLANSQQTAIAPTARTSLPTFSVSDPLTSERVKAWFSGYQPPKATVVPATTQSGSFTGSTGGGYGLSAYGFKGTSGTAGTRGSAKYGFTPQMWDALQQANTALAKAGLGTFGITDGWRSLSAQVDLKKRKPTLAATPGRSVHGIGLAADLNLTSKQQKWLEANGAKYGLARLPSEAWHWQLLPSVWNGGK